MYGILSCIRPPQSGTNTFLKTCFGSTYTKIGTIQRRLAWPLRKDDMQLGSMLHPKHTPWPGLTCGFTIMGHFAFRYVPEDLERETYDGHTFKKP